LARIAGIDLPRDKKVEYALTSIFGIGLSSAKEIVAEAGVDPNTRTRDLTESEVSDLRKVIETSYRIEGDLRRELSMNIRRLIEIGSYRGLRHRRNLPVRGQRTKTNARMRKGPKRQVGVRRKASM